MNQRIGPAMKSACRYLAAVGGVAPSALQVAEACGPHHSRQYGYRTVSRLLIAGLARRIHDHPLASPHGVGAVVLTDKGREYA